jgi:hypothetical protein
MNCCHPKIRLFGVVEGLEAGRPGRTKLFLIANIWYISMKKKIFLFYLNRNNQGGKSGSRYPGIPVSLMYPGIPDVSPVSPMYPGYENPSRILVFGIHW